MLRRIALFLFICLAGHGAAFAQSEPAKTDSSKVYRNIESFSKKRKLTKLIYGLIFKPVIPVEPKEKKKPKQLQKPYSAFEGKIIRHIDIVTFDPFGYSLDDTVTTTKNFLYDVGNKLHVKTQRITILNLLLIHKNDIFDSLLVKESERLIRSQKYVHEVSLLVFLTEKNSDSVDIFIREIDIASLVPSGGISASQVTLGLTDENFFGLGHQFQNSVTLSHPYGTTPFTTNYFIPNIRNTYVNVTLHYDVDEYGYYNKSIDIERPFFSPFAKWAGGVIIEQQHQRDSLDYHDLGYELENYKFNTQDYWAGTSHQIFKGATEDKRTTDLILAARFLHTHYLETPPEIYDSLHVFSDQNFYLAAIGITTRKFVQDKYIFNYGPTEDIPIGRTYLLTSGYQVKNNIGRPYLGVKFSWGDYNKWGYFSTDWEYGTFLHAGQTEQGVFTVGLDYFTHLFEIGNWKFRQFVKPQFTMGLNRFASDTLNLNNQNGIRGFSTTTLTGTQKIVLTLQTQAYSPWDVLGFQLGPYIIYSAAMLGDQSSGFQHSRLYSQFGIGLLIKNEYLIFNIFQVSIAFYPNIPGVGNDVLKTNPYKTTDLGFPDFSIGKPAPVAYQ